MKFRAFVVLALLVLAIVIPATAQKPQQASSNAPVLTASVELDKTPFMKRKPLYNIYLLDSAGKLFFYVGHSVDLSWTASPDAVTGSLNNIKRGTGACLSNPTLSVIGTVAHPAVTYSDATVSVGAYCYTVSVTVNGAESPNSNTVTALILPAAPTGLTATPH